MATLPELDTWREAYDEEQLTEIPNCYCTSCGNSNAVSTILPTKIPMFREIMIMTLNCDVSPGNSLADDVI